MEQIREAGALLLQLIRELLALARIRQRLLLLVAERFQFLAELRLLLRHLPRFIAHLAHLVGELARTLLPEIIPQLLQLLLRARAGSERLRRLLLLQRLGRLLHVAPRLLQLLTRLRHLRLILRALHPLLQLVHIRQHLLLFLAQPFQPALDLLALLVGLRLLQR